MKKRKPIVLLIGGARPNFMKISAIVESIKKFNSGKNEFQPRIDYLVVHTGQHYDDGMSKVFFDDLRLPPPDVYLGVGSGTHAEQTGRIMIEFEKVCLKEKPDLVVVVGDVNSTIACALVAAKLFIPVAHVESGLRSRDRTMPEEVNRILTDQISDYLFTTCVDANRNLKKEGVPEEKIFFVGNVMIDTLKRFIVTAEKSNVLDKLGLRVNGRITKYAVLTLHRPSNVDDAGVLKGIFSALKELAKRIPVIFPAHPRTLKRIKNFLLDNMMTYVGNFSDNDLDKSRKSVLAISPLGYKDFLNLMSNASIVLTDSGGIQEETTILGIPCLTLRENTERPITVREGTNILVGNNPERILSTSLSTLEKRLQIKRMPEFWDGKAADRIVKILARKIF